MSEALPTSEQPTFADMLSAIGSPESAAWPTACDLRAGPMTCPCGQEVFRAKTCQLPGAERVLRAHEAGCGGNGHVSLTRADRRDCSLRMSLLCELAGLTTCSIGWRRETTPAGRSWWVVTTSEHRCGITECGFWRRPLAVDSKCGSSKGRLARYSASQRMSKLADQCRLIGRRDLLRSAQFRLMADGLPGGLARRADRLKAIGNAVDPQVVAAVARAWLRAMEATE